MREGPKENQSPGVHVPEDLRLYPGRDHEGQSRDQRSRESFLDCLIAHRSFDANRLDVSKRGDTHCSSGLPVGEVEGTILNAAQGRQHVEVRINAFQW